MIIKFKVNSNTYLRTSEIPFKGTELEIATLVEMTNGLKDLVKKKLAKVSVSPNTTIEIGVSDNLRGFSSGQFSASGMVDDVEGEAIRQALKQS